MPVPIMIALLFANIEILKYLIKPCRTFIQTLYLFLIRNVVSDVNKVKLNYPLSETIPCGC